ncbi:ABC transporter transmembrane domain-containing protein [Paenibacillus ginsengarvi]|uniref:ATP-binding cassette domain-containing protein n=1 Tax=Paenibacillus ginsengarvi TaxID=400777 RepID=A0A3B0BZB3_9BACL|nr:ABC transporter transmembrane domain-containing protein [Paenibacillus ginsengarvi]RKN78953.1 ATP-binding cassette domain-containing protein [Paenibacillus ginsengarvi]
MISKIVRYASAHKWLSVFVICGILLEVAYTMVSPLSLKYMIDEAFTPKNAALFVLILTIMLASGLISVGAGIGGDYSLSRLSGHIVERIRSGLFGQMQKQAPEFFAGYRSGDMITRFTSDISAMERLISFSFPYTLKEGIGGVVGLALLFQLQWKLTLAMIGGTLLVFIGPRLLQGRAERFNRQVKEEQERFANTIDEHLKGYKTIRGLALQAVMKQRAHAHIRSLFTLGLRQSLTNSLLERLPVTGLLGLNGIMLGYGGYLIFQDELSIGSFVAFLTLFMSFGTSVSNLAMVLPLVIEAKVSYSRIDEVMRHRPSVEEPEQPVALPPVSREIRYEGVSFGYTDDAAALSDIELNIPAGSLTAFVGPSGSGKSTALELLLRFYDPKRGRITLDGVDLRDVGEAELRGQMSVVFQDTFLFNDTIRHNLLAGADTATEADMIRAAREAAIHETILKWKNGYDTVITGQGGSLSGGQRQRLSIARALIRRPSILLLDEATSALDPATEADINELITGMKGQRTIVMVTHRLSSAQQANPIVVFKDGQVVEAGSHEELLGRDGLYREMWDKQNGFTLSGDGFHAKIDGKRLSRLPFLQGIDMEALESVSSLFASEAYVSGQTIVREGDEGDKLYIIVRGTVAITRGGEKVATLQDGDYFGEIALLRNIPRTATVTAVEPTTVLSLRRSGFTELTNQYPQLRETVESTLLSRLK